MTEEVVPVPEASPAKKSFLAALAKAQGMFEPIIRARRVIIRPKDSSAYEFNYAELAEILAKTRPACAANGLSLRSRMLPGATGESVWLQSILAHADGHEDISEISVTLGADLKQFGGRLTYLRRYLGTCQLGIASEDDVEEDGVEAGEAAPPPRAAPQRGPKTTKNKQETAPSEAEFATGQVASPGYKSEQKAKNEEMKKAVDETPVATNGGPKKKDPVIVPGQAKWLKTKLEANFDDELQMKEFLMKFGARPEDIDDMTEAQFGLVRAGIIAL
jgi:hypothetical protein